MRWSRAQVRILRSLGVVLFGVCVEYRRDKGFDRHATTGSFGDEALGELG